MDRSGVCIWFTGQSGAGKTTITRELVPRLEALGRTVSVLDVVPLMRKRWWERTSEGKLLRKAYVAMQIVNHGGVAIAVTVSARATVRDRAREMVGPERFVEVLVAPPPEVAAARKAARPSKQRPSKRIKRMIRRGLSALRPTTRQDGSIAVRAPDLEIDSSVVEPASAAQQIIDHLERRGLLLDPTRRA